MKQKQDRGAEEELTFAKKGFLSTRLEIQGAAEDGIEEQVTKALCISRRSTNPVNRPRNHLEHLLLEQTLTCGTESSDFTLRFASTES